MTRSEQARLLYALLDAAEDEHRLIDPAMVERWLTLKAHFDDARGEELYGALDALFDELDRSGVLVGTWIQARWLAAKARAESSAPFPKYTRSTAAPRPPC